jgi:hypothetical protein
VQHGAGHGAVTVCQINDGDDIRRMDGYVVSQMKDHETLRISSETVCKSEQFRIFSNYNSIPNFTLFFKCSAGFFAGFYRLKSNKKRRLFSASFSYCEITL